MSVRRGSKVWVEDRDSAWSAAEVVDYVGKQVQVVTVSGKKVGDFWSWFRIHFCGLVANFVCANIFF